MDSRRHKKAGYPLHMKGATDTFSSKCPYQGRLHLHLSGLEIRVCGCLTPGSRQKNVTILLKICYMLHVKKLLYS